MLNEKIKRNLYIQIEPIYEISKPKLTEKEIEKRIEVFSMVLSLANNCEAESLRNIEKDIETLLESIERTAKAEVNKTNINLIEPYFRLLCLLVDKKGFYARGMEKATLGKLYSHDKLDVLNTDKNGKRSNYYDILFRKGINGEPIEYGDNLHPENVLKEDLEIFPFVEAYCIRNAVIHYQKLPYDKWEHFLCMFYTMIETSYKHKTEIITQFIEKEISRKNYISKIIKEYKQKIGENFTYIPIDIDIYGNDLYDALEKRYKTSEKSVTFETINEDLNLNSLILKGNLLLNKAKIIGYAGMGKTTTIENIIYKEALENQKNNYQGKIPILIEMIQVTKLEDTIEKLIAKKIGTDNMLVVSEIIEKNMINLYIDGINEMRIQNGSDKRKYLNTIEEFMIENKNLKVVITDRDNNENSILNHYPTFLLLGITKEKITEFIRGNSNKPEIVETKILEKIEQMPSFMNTLKNPFILKNLITIIECNQDIPEYEDDIAEVFLKSIVERERVIKRDYKAPHILRLLIYVVGKYVEMNEEEIGENMVISYYQLIDLFNEYCDRYKRNDRFDYDEMLDLIVKLGILKQVGTEKYTFVDETYYNFFYYSAIELL